MPLKARVKLLTTWVYLFLLILLIPAEEGPKIVLSVDEAVQIAFERNLALQSELLSVRMAEISYKNRWNLFYPSISAQTTLLRLNKAPINPIPGGEDPPRWNLGANLESSLTLALPMRYRMEASGLSYQGSKLELESVKREIEIQIRKAFYQILLQKEQIKLIERRIAASQQRYLEAKEDYERGGLDEFTLLSLQVSLENLKPPLRRAVQGYNLSLQQFKQTLGIPKEENLDLEGSILGEPAILPPLEKLKEGINDSLPLRKAQLGLYQLENSLKLTSASFYPTVTFRVGFDPSLSGDPFSSDLFDFDKWKQRSGSFSTTVRISLDPLLPGSGIKAERENLLIRQRQMQISLQRTKEAMELQTSSLIEELSTSRETIDILKMNLALAERAYTLAQEGYNHGLRTILQVRDAEIELENARLELLREEYRYREALLDLEHLLSISPGF